MITKRGKLISAAIAILFLVFAAVQYNDPDSGKWIAAYLVPSILFFLILVDKYFYKSGRIAMIIFIFSGLLYIPDLLNWVRTGMPSITETMQAEKPLVELMREFLGLVIISVALFYYTILKGTDSNKA